MRDRSSFVQTFIILKPLRLRPRAIIVVLRVTSFLPRKRGCAGCSIRAPWSGSTHRFLTSWVRVELHARSRFIKQIPVPDLNAEQKDLSSQDCRVPHLSPVPTDNQRQGFSPRKRLCDAQVFRADNQRAGV